MHTNYLYLIVLIILGILVSKKYRTTIYSKLGYFRYVILIPLFLCLIISTIFNGLLVFLPIIIILGVIILFIDWIEFNKYK